ncbi:MAG: exosortase/archaeosortase family protein [Candidatus Bathyarchaeia archaeon]
MQTIRAILKKHEQTLVKLAPLIAFLTPLLLLSLLNPVDPLLNPIDPALGYTALESFGIMWKGRAFQLFFLWLIGIELILDWEKIETTKNKLTALNTSILMVALSLPTIYMITSNYVGLNTKIADCALQNNIHRWNLMPLATEYFAYAFFYSLIIFLIFNSKSLMTFTASLFFLITVGALYTIDNIYPYGQFTLFQFLVPTTATLAANVLEFMGYHVNLYNTDNLPRIVVTDLNTFKSVMFDVAWPCAGIESLLIFTVVALLFLKRMPFSWKEKIGYFAVGSAVTYLINVLRVTAIFIIAINGDWRPFHDVYGPLCSITWIASYPLLILATQNIRHRFTKRKQKFLSSPNLHS